MALVGAFPSMRELSRRAIRGPVNPLDRSTIVSIYPKPIKFKNVTLTPGRWFLPAGSAEEPAMLMVGPSSWFKDVSLEEPLIEIVQSSIQIAESLIKDWCNGLFACNMNDAMPGIFFVPGKITVDKIKTDYADLLPTAIRNQNNYYRNLVRYAEALWARSNGNPLALNDEMRMAAKALGQVDFEWMKDTASIGLVRCFACGEFKSPDYPICKSCRSVDMNHPKASQIVTAPENK